ncbi:MAG: OmpH family outer membrane protein [Candidatus Krumholzibacteria bacterium]|nr:OmpH family outer membrane protein [Candidatus Krumholzibacteria bacterium]
MRIKMITALVLVVFIVPITSISLLAQDGKIGYIDSIKIFAEYQETQDAERVYRQEVDQWTAQKQRMEQDIVKLRDELQAQSLMLSEEKKKEKKLELDRKMAEYQQFMDETFGDEGLAARRNKELTQPIVEKINLILEDLGKEQGYSIIFDVANANIVYANKALDLTDVVLGKLREMQ